MSRRRQESTEALSLDSFLDIVTNVVGVLILVAVVTVLSAGDITVATGATALRAPPRAKASRVLVECARGEVFFVDEEKIAAKVTAIAIDMFEEPDDSESIVSELERRDVGNELYRIQAEGMYGGGTAWVYRLRDDARGDTVEDFGKDRADLQRLFETLSSESYVYFVVHDDSFDVFRAARDQARARGLATGWHPVEGETPLRISATGSLGKRVQ